MQQLQRHFTTSIQRQIGNFSLILMKGCLAANKGVCTFILQLFVQVKKESNFTS